MSDASEIRRVKVKAQKWVVPKCQTLEDLFTFFDTPKYFEFWSTSSALAGASFGLWHCVFMAKSLGFAPRQIRLQQTGDRVWFAFVTLFSAKFLNLLNGRLGQLDTFVTKGYCTGGRIFAAPAPQLPERKRL